MPALTDMLTGASMLCLATSLILLSRHVFANAHTPARRAYFLAELGLGCLLVHFAETAWRVQGMPLVSLRDSILVFAAVLLGTGLAAGRATSSHFPTAAVLPLALGLQALSLCVGGRVPSPSARAAAGSAFLASHILLFTLSYALFILAAVFAGLFLALERMLKARRTSPILFILFRLPGLQRLDQYARQASLTGLLFLTLAMALAFASLGRLGTGASHPAFPASDFTIASTMTLWVYYACAAVLHLRLGWAGRRSACLALAGVMLLLLFYFAGRLGPTRSQLHGYSPPQASSSTTPLGLP